MIKVEPVVNDVVYTVVVETLANPIVCTVSTKKEALEKANCFRFDGLCRIKENIIGKNGEIISVKDDSMRKSPAAHEIEYECIKYPTRTVSVGANYFTVSVKTLSDRLIDEEATDEDMKFYTSPEAMAIDEQIFYYIDKDEIPAVYNSVGEFLILGGEYEIIKVLLKSGALDAEMVIDRGE